MHFPGFSLDAAKFLVEGRNVAGLGIDTLSIDYGPSKDFEVHQYTLAHGLYHLENVASLAQTPDSGATVVVGPAKLEGGSGGPVRILALVR
jgi:kynurenine formamidase